MSQETLTRVAALKRSAPHRPAGTFLAVLVTYSALVATGIFTILEGIPRVLNIVVYAWGPMISAGVTVWVLDESVRDWVGQLRNVRVGPRWYLIGIGVMLLGTEFENIIAVVLGSDIVVPAYPPMTYVIPFVVTLFLAGALEELGWRGFLQPHLQQRFDAVWVSIGIGVTWAVWHIPMMVAGFGDFAAFWEYTLNITAISIVYGWLYNTTDAALPVVMITHAAHNIPPISTSTGTVPTIFTTVSGDTMIYITCALLVTLYAGSRTLTRDGTLPGIPGQPRGRSPGSGTSAD